MSEIVPPMPSATRTAVTADFVRSFESRVNVAKVNVESA